MTCNRVVAHETCKVLEAVGVWDQDHSTEEARLCHRGEQLAGETNIFQVLPGTESVNDVLEDFVGELRDQ